MKIGAKERYAPNEGTKHRPSVEIVGPSLCCYKISFLESSKKNNDLYEKKVFPVISHDKFDRLSGYFEKKVKGNVVVPVSLQNDPLPVLARQEAEDEGDDSIVFRPQREEA